MIVGTEKFIDADNIASAASIDRFIKGQTISLILLTGCAFFLKLAIGHSAAVRRIDRIQKLLNKVRDPILLPKAPF